MSTMGQTVWGGLDVPTQLLGFILLFIVPLLSVRVRRTFGGRKRGLLFASYLPVRLAFYLVVTMGDFAKARSTMCEKTGAQDVDNQWASARSAPSLFGFPPQSKSL